MNLIYILKADSPRNAGSRWKNKGVSRVGHYISGSLSFSIVRGQGSSGGCGKPVYPAIFGSTIAAFFRSRLHSQTEAVDMYDEPDIIILPDELQRLTCLLDNSLETLALGSPKIQAEALSTTKHIFELCM